MTVSQPLSMYFDSAIPVTDSCQVLREGVLEARAGIEPAYAELQSTT
jgi:hypothetical protein